MVATLLQNQTISLTQTQNGDLDRKRRRALPSLGALAPLNCEFSGWPHYDCCSVCIRDRIRRRLIKVTHGKGSCECVTVSASLPLCSLTPPCGVGGSPLQSAGCAAVGLSNASRPPAFAAELQAWRVRAPSTLGDSSASQPKHCRALQINHEGPCQGGGRRKTTRRGMSCFRQTGGERREEGFGAVMQGAELEWWGGGLERVVVFTRCRYPAFLRHPDQLWWLNCY